MQCSREMLGVIDERHGVTETRCVSFVNQNALRSGGVCDAVFLTNIPQKLLR